MIINFCTSVWIFINLKKVLYSNIIDFIETAIFQNPVLRPHLPNFVVYLPLLICHFSLDTGKQESLCHKGKMPFF